MPAWARSIRSKHEMCFVYRVGSTPHANMVELGKHGRNRTNVWTIRRSTSMAGSRREDLDLHPTVKPVAMVADAYQDVTKRGDLVFDMFLGPALHSSRPSGPGGGSGM